MRTLVILGPNKIYKSGVLDYSKLIHKILSARNNDFATKIICPTEIHQYKEILQKPDTLLLVQVGANDAQVLRSLQIIKKINPKIKRVLEIHDPSTIVISTHQILDNVKRLFPRILRKIFHKLFIKKMVNKIIIESDIIICKSNFGKLILQKKFNFKNKIYVIQIPNYLDPPLDSNFKFTNKKITIGFFGFIDKAKGIHLLIQALNIYQKINQKETIRLIIAGEPLSPKAIKYHNSLKKYVKKYQLSNYVVFKNYLENDIGLIDFIRSVNYIALPYINKSSGSSSGPLRWSLTCGTPVIASNTEVFKEILPKIFLVEKNNAESWANLFEKILSRTLCSEKYINNFISDHQQKNSWDNINESYTLIFSELWNTIKTVDAFDSRI